MMIDAKILAECDARPFLKWAGGKTQLLPEILAALPEEMDYYVEPFLGGGAVFFALVASGRIKGHAVLCDMNEHLIRTYCAVKEDPIELVGRLRWFQKHCGSADAYYDIRDQSLDPAKKDWRGERFERAARFIYLNKMGYNGMYRENKQGAFNIPYCKDDKRKWLDEENIHACSRALNEVDAVLLSGDYNKALPYSEQDTQRVVYLDPPYEPLNATSNFTSYTKGGFNLIAQVELAARYEMLLRHGHHAVLSNSTAAIRHYENIPTAIRMVKARRSINSKGHKRGAIDEILVMPVSAMKQSIALDENTRRWKNGVQRANASKAKGELRADGKRLKPAGWTPPDIRSVLAEILYSSRSPKPEPIDGVAHQCACDGATDDGCENCWDKERLRKEYRLLKMR